MHHAAHTAVAHQKHTFIRIFFLQLIQKAKHAVGQLGGGFPRFKVVEKIAFAAKIFFIKTISAFINAVILLQPQPALPSLLSCSSSHLSVVGSFWGLSLSLL